MRVMALGFAVMLGAAGCSAPASNTAGPAESTPAPAPAAVGAPAGESMAAAPAESQAPLESPAAAPAAAPAGHTAAAPAPAPAPAGSPAAPAPAAVPAPAPAPAEPPAPPAPEYREVTIPAGTQLSVELRTALASNTSQVEDRVQGVLRRALTVDGTEVGPAGAAVSGAVIDAQQAGRVKGRARLALRFTSIAIDDSDVRMSTGAIAREAEGTKKQDAAKIGIGAGAGAVVGAITGGKKGAVVGGTIGAGAGTGVVLATRGDEVTLASGAVLTTTLSQPLVVRLRVR
ncbi:MAG: hypothetical protein R2708_18365 [Vicinamibacterales bacterium]